MKLKIVGLGGIGSHLLLPLMQYINYEQNTFDEIWFVDGDSYESKNMRRQHVTKENENKAISQKKYYKDLFPDMTITHYDGYVTEENIKRIVQEDDVVLLCVDNNKTRRLFQERLFELNNLTLISGGNELYDGNVMICQKANGKMNSRTFFRIG